MKQLVIALALSSFAAATFAAAETYAIDPNHTAPRFEYSHLGYSNQVHGFDKTSGSIVLDRTAKSASVDVSIDATSVNTGIASLNRELQGEAYFNAAQYPTITFKSTAVTFEGDKPVAVEGNLTIKGVTKPVTLTLTHFLAMPHPMLKRNTIGANAVTKIKRSEFNMGKLVPFVSDEVTLSISVEAIQQP